MDFMIAMARTIFRTVPLLAILLGVVSSSVASAGTSSWISLNRTVLLFT